jgi:hypothetical protein
MDDLGFLSLGNLGDSSGEMLEQNSLLNPRPPWAQGLECEM